MLGEVCQSACHSKHVRMMMALTFLMVIIALGSYAMLNFERIKYVNTMPSTISVSGEGEVTTIPDVGVFSFAVTAEGKDAKEAQEASATKINAILAFLKEQKIEDKDVKTENYNINEKFHWQENPCAMESVNRMMMEVEIAPTDCYGKQVFDGFEASQMVTVKIRDTKNSGAIISGVGEKGATNISNLRFIVDNTDAMKMEARAKAIANANEKAVILAQQLGVRLVRVTSFYEEEGYYAPYYDKAMGMSEMSMDASITPEMPVGEENTTARVNVTFEIK